MGDSDEDWGEVDFMAGASRMVQSQWSAQDLKAKREKYLQL